jgi:flagellar hook-associated protein 3 FlgL
MVLVPSFPTQLLHTASSSYVARMQSDLARLQREVSSGRRDDLGLSLGIETAKDISLRIHLSDVQFNLEQASQVQPKGQLVQTSLDAVAKLAKNFLDAVSGARGAADGQSIAVQAARTALGSLRDILNTTYAGQYIFGGQNSDTAPFSDPLSGDPDAAIGTAFQSEFGVPRDDASVSAISGSAMDAFLTGTYAQLFEQPSWANWSKASDANIQQRLGSISVDVGSNANADFARTLTQAFSMMSSLGEGNLSQAAFTAAVDRATSLAFTAQSQIGTEQARIGLSQQRVTEEIASLEIRKTTFTNAVNALESVDPYGIATEINSLMTRLQSSYSITARISQLSLLNYL